MGIGAIATKRHAGTRWLAAELFPDERLAGQEVNDPRLDPVRAEPPAMGRPQGRFGPLQPSPESLAGPAPVVGSRSPPAHTGGGGRFQGEAEWLRWLRMSESSSRSNSRPGQGVRPIVGLGVDFRPSASQAPGPMMGTATTR